MFSRGIQDKGKGSSDRGAKVSTGVIVVGALRAGHRGCRCCFFPVSCGRATGSRFRPRPFWIIRRDLILLCSGGIWSGAAGSLTRRASQRQSVHFFEIALHVRFATESARLIIFVTQGVPARSDRPCDSRRACRGRPYGKEGRAACGLFSSYLAQQESSWWRGGRLNTTCHSSSATRRPPRRRGGVGPGLLAGYIDWPGARRIGPFSGCDSAVICYCKAPCAQGRCGLFRRTWCGSGVSHRPSRFVRTRISVPGMGARRPLLPG